jgi:competence protein ComEA
MSFWPEIFFNRRQRLETIVLCAICTVLFVIVVLPKQHGNLSAQRLNFENYNVEIEEITNIDSWTPAELQPFNPNFISDYRAYVLKLPSKAIERLNRFRGSGQWINSVEQFQNVTQISDELLSELKPLFVFPKWTQQPSRAPEFASASKIDLNQATSEQLEKVYGIGPTRAKQIINYRDGTLGGFASMIELRGIIGLSEEVIAEMGKRFEVKTPRQINTFNAQTVNVDELVTIPFIDYELAHKIVEQRSLHGGLLNKDILSRIKNLPLNKIDIILLYLDFHNQ